MAAPFAEEEIDCGSPEVSPQKLASPDDGDTPDGLEEIENAFARVSMVADALLDSINDDSLRSKERKRGNRSQSYISDSEDDTKDDDRPLDTDDGVKDYITSYGTNHHRDSDVSTMDEGTMFSEEELSLDGSLVHDMNNLKSVTKTMQEEMQKHEEEFKAYGSGNANSFFQKLEEAKAAEDSKTVTPRIRNGERRPPSVLTVNARAATNLLPVSPLGSRGLVVMPPPRPKPISFLEQVQLFCNQLLGKDPNLPLFVMALAIWLAVFKLVFEAKTRLLDAEGKIQVPTVIYRELIAWLNGTQV